jgi:hypothetical protein
MDIAQPAHLEIWQYSVGRVGGTLGPFGRYRLSCGWRFAARCGARHAPDYCLGEIPSVHANSSVSIFAYLPGAGQLGDALNCCMAAAFLSFLMRLDPMSREN